MLEARSFICNTGLRVWGLGLGFRVEGLGLRGLGAFRQSSEKLFVGGSISGFYNKKDVYKARVNTQTAFLGLWISWQICGISQGLCGEQIPKFARQQTQTKLRTPGHPSHGIRAVSPSLKHILSQSQTSQLGGCQN